MVAAGFRESSGKRYFVAFVITFMVFVLGLSIGLVVDNERVRSIENQNKEQSLRYESMQFQYLFINTLNSSGDSCVVLEKTIENLMKDLSESLADLESYNQDSDFNKDKFKILSRQYIIDNLNYWLFAEKAKKECGIDIVTVLYFFDSKNCPTCDNQQGPILTFYKKQLENRLLIFPLDLANEKDEPSLSVLRAKYNITELPSIVVGDKVYGGLVGKRDFANITCHDYADKPDFCER